MISNLIIRKANIGLGLINLEVIRMEGFKIVAAAFFFHDPISSLRNTDIEENNRMEWNLSLGGAVD